MNKLISATRKARRCSSALSLLSIAALMLAGSATASAQTVTTYDATATSSNTFPIAINLGGTAAGYFIDSEGFHGYLRAPSGTITTFNPPADSPTSGTTTVFGLNNPGAVVGTYTNPSFVQTGYMRDPSGNFTDIAPPGSTLTSVNMSINDSGEIAGSWVDSSLPRKTHGFVRDPAGNYTSFDIGVPTTNITVASINSSGQVAGYYSDATFHNHGFVRGATGAITTFDAPAPYTDITVFSMNDKQQITGYYTDHTTYLGYVRQGTTIASFQGDPSATETLPQSINVSGTIVGYDCVGFNNCNGFVRTPPVTGPITGVGSIASLNLPNASNTQPNSVNDLGRISGIWLDDAFSRHGFIASFTQAAPTSGIGCNGTYNGTFNGSLVVLAGQTCNFIGGGVHGNVISLGGTLGLSNATVSGSVLVGRGVFSIGPSTAIQGSLQIAFLPGPSSQNQVCGATVGGDLQFQNNGAPVQIGSASPSCPGNVIGGNLKLQDNTGAIAVFDNTVSGNLQCRNNSSISGSGNMAGHKQGQCAGF